MRTWLAVGALLLAGCAFDAADRGDCRTDADCAAGACRDGVCVAFATPLDEPVDPSDPPDAGAPAR